MDGDGGYVFQRTEVCSCGLLLRAQTSAVTAPGRTRRSSRPWLRTRSACRGFCRSCSRCSRASDNARSPRTRRWVAARWSAAASVPGRRTTRSSRPWLRTRSACHVRRRSCIRHWGTDFARAVSRARSLFLRERKGGFSGRRDDRSLSSLNVGGGGALTSPLQGAASPFPLGEGLYV